MEKGPQSEGLRSLSLELENFKNISAKKVDINGKSMIFIGKNGKGKSSLIQAMKGSLSSKELPEMPIKKGEERARVTHVIGGNINGEHREYTIDIFFSPKNNSGRVEVYNSEGEKQKSPATFLKSLIGDTSFSITGFIHADKKKRIEMIKKLTGKGVEIDSVTMEIEKIKADRKYKTERYEALEGSLNNHGMTQEEIEKYSTPVSLDAINHELQEVSRRQGIYDSAVSKLSQFKNDFKSCEDSINQSHNEIAQLEEMIRQKRNFIQQKEAERDIAVGSINKAEAWLAANQRPTSEEVSLKMAEASAHNEKHMNIMRYSEQHREMTSLKAEVDKLKNNIKIKEDERSRLIASSQLPVEGMTFDDNDIYLNGIPLEEGQVNTAMIWKVGVQIAVAMNPTYKVIFLDEGSLLDHDMLKEVITYIEQKGYMAIVEVVGENEEVECLFTEQQL